VFFDLIMQFWHSWRNHFLQNPKYCSPGAGSAKNNSKNKNQIFEKKNFQFFLYGEKDNFEKYFLNLASVKLSFPILINYSVGRCWTCPRTTVWELDKVAVGFLDYLSCCTSTSKNHNLEFYGIYDIIMFKQQCFFFLSVILLELLHSKICEN
jgi:hypothetical protein